MGKHESLARKLKDEGNNCSEVTRSLIIYKLAVNCNVQKYLNKKIKNEILEL